LHRNTQQEKNKQGKEIVKLTDGLAIVASRPSCPIEGDIHKRSSRDTTKGIRARRIALTYLPKKQNQNMQRSQQLSCR
jgi:hypothetical protein